MAIARAVAELRVLAELCLPLVRPGGHWVAAKGAAPAGEVAAAANALGKLGGRLLAVEEVDSGEGSTRMDTGAGAVPLGVGGAHAGSGTRLVAASAGRQASCLTFPRRATWNQSLGFAIGTEASPCRAAAACAACPRPLHAEAVDIAGHFC